MGDAQQIGLFKHASETYPVIAHSPQRQCLSALQLLKHDPSGGQKDGVTVLLLTVQKRNKARELVLKIRRVDLVYTDALYKAQYAHNHRIIK